MPVTMVANADHSLTLLEHVFWQSPAFIAVLSGAEFVVELANPAYLRMVECPDLVGRKIFDVLPEAGDEGYRDLLRSVLASGEPIARREVPFTLRRTSDGAVEQRVVDFTYLPIRDGSGQVTRVFVHGMDVTSHVRAREQQDREKLALLAELELNRAREAQSITEELQRQQRETERTNSDLHEVAIELAVRTLEAEDARRDVERLLRDSERARGEAESARREAEAANRSKAEFLAAMSHELRTPLNAIGGYTELLEMGIRGPVTASQVEDLQRIRISQRHLLRLVNEILNYARIETGSVHYDVADVPIGPLLESLDALVAPQVAARELHFNYGDHGSDRLVVRADREKTRQVLLNLLSNAIKFTTPGGIVEITCEADDAMVHVKVCDSGIGIPDAEQERVFEPFVQVDASLTRRHEGAGLGLAISRDLARGMGGDLTVVSTPGSGSTFTLSLPRATAVSSGDAPRD